MLVTLLRACGERLFCRSGDGPLCEGEMPLDIANDSIRLIGSKMGGARLQTDIPTLLTHYRSGGLKLDELVSGCYSLEDINKAIDSVKRSEALRNVIVFYGESA